MAIAARVYAEFCQTNKVGQRGICCLDRAPVCCFAVHSPETVFTVHPVDRAVTQLDDQLDQCMPEITKLCVHLQGAYNKLQALLAQPEQEEAADLQEFVVLQLLILAKVPPMRATTPVCGGRWPGTLTRVFVCTGMPI